MKKSRYIGRQILKIPKQNKVGISVAGLCRVYVVSGTALLLTSIVNGGARCLILNRP